MSTKGATPLPKRWGGLRLGHETWRSDLLRVVLRVLTVCGSLVCVPSVIFALKFHMTGIAVMDTTAIVALFTLSASARMPPKLRAGLCCLVLYGLGTGLMIGVGSISQTYLLGFSLLTTLLLSVRWGLVTVLLNAVTMLSIGYVGLSAPEMMANRWTGTIATWSIISANFVMVNGCLVMALGAVIGALESTIGRALGARHALEHEQGELLRLNASLADTRALLRLAGRSAHLGGWQVHVGDDRVEWSEEVCTIHEMPVGTAPTFVEALAFFVDGSRATVRDVVGRCMRDGTAFDCEAKIVVASGSRKWVRIIGDAARSAAGAVLQVHGSIQDITSQKMAESQHERLEEQLRQAQKMETVGSLAAGVAHDFNNLMSVVLSYSQMISDDLPANDPMREDLDEIRNAGVRASELTRQLLAFGRRQVLEPKIVDLSDVVGGMEKMLRRLIGEDVELTTQCASGLGRVKVDPGQIEQVVMNLAVNARDAMPQGGKLTIETRVITLDESYAADHVGVTAGAHVMLAVSDTGSGMDKATQARIFEPFYTTKDPGKGTGLGLSTVFGIVQQSGATIWVYSELGTGTTFKIYFPIADRADAAPALTVVAKPKDLLGTETILLVEDEAQVRAVVDAILRRRGYDVLAADSGDAAIALSEAHAGAIHLLLTDVVMPGMSGRQLAERLAEIRPAMKTLFMSGYTDDAVVRHGVLESTLDFLQKPLTPETLARKVRDVLDAPKRS